MMRVRSFKLPEDENHPERRLTYSLIGLALLLPQAAAIGSAQSSERYHTEPKYFVKNDAGAVCEMNNLYIDLLVGEAKKSKERIFVISKLGKGEKYQISERRLWNAHFFLTDGKDIASNQIVRAVGTRAANGIGRLESYLGSQLFLVSEAKRGKGVCLNCCPV